MQIGNAFSVMTTHAKAVVPVMENSEEAPSTINFTPRFAGHQPSTLPPTFRFQVFRPSGFLLSLLLSSFFHPKQHGADGAEDDLQVEGEAEVANVVEVVFELVAGVVDAVAVGIL